MTLSEFEKKIAIYTHYEETPNFKIYVENRVPIAKTYLLKDADEYARFAWEHSNDTVKDFYVGANTLFITAIPFTSGCEIEIEDRLSWGDLEKIIIEYTELSESEADDVIVEMFSNIADFLNNESPYKNLQEILDDFLYGDVTYTFDGTDLVFYEIN